MFCTDILCFLVLFRPKFQCCFVIFDTKQHEMIRWPKAVFDHILRQLLIKLFISNVPFIVALSYAKIVAFPNERQPLPVPLNPHKIWEFPILMSKKTVCTQAVSNWLKISKGSLHSYKELKAGQKYIWLSQKLSILFQSVFQSKKSLSFSTDFPPSTHKNHLVKNSR